ncbi:MAG: NAD(P)/FAD-dependent oxidoreductase [Desulfocapsaceae bacterium]
MSKLVLLGGGHAHLTILANLRQFAEEGHEVTVVQPADHHYYSGMGPGMLGGTYEPDQVRFNTLRIVERQGGIFVKDRAVSIDAQNRTVRLFSGVTLPYDLLSCNTGSSVPVRTISENIDSVIPVKPIEGLARARKIISTRLKSSNLSIAVIGGGPSALEIAGNLRQLGDRIKGYELKIILFSGRRLLADSTPWLQKNAQQILFSRRIELSEGSYVSSVQDGTVSLVNGNNYTFNLIFAALGVEPSPLFANSGLSVGNGIGLEVNRYLQSTKHPEIFGGGDCIHFSEQPLDKVGVYAVRQNPVLLHNIRASLRGEKLQGFEPGKKYLLIYNTGDAHGIFLKGSIRFTGRLAFMIKDYIDRRFMHRFKKLEH